MKHDNLFNPPFCWRYGNMDVQATQLVQQQAMAQAVNSNAGKISSRQHPSHVAALLFDR